MRALAQRTFPKDFSEGLDKLRRLLSTVLHGAAAANTIVRRGLTGKGRRHNVPEKKEKLVEELKKLDPSRRPRSKKGVNSRLADYR